jgi:ribosomal protein L37AE/L43A
MVCRCLKEDCNGYLEKMNDHTYICKECKSVYSVCQECDGEGFAQTENGIFDCDACNGAGLMFENN